MTDKNTIIRTALVFTFLTTLALGAVYSMYIHLSASENSELHRLKITAAQEKTILGSVVMAGGIQWNKPDSIASVHSTYAGSEIAAGLTNVLAIDDKENEVYSAASESGEKIDLNALLKIHRLEFDNATHFSLDTGTHVVTMVAAFDKKETSSAMSPWPGSNKAPAVFPAT